MADNLKTIQLRMQTVNKVSKMTNAMKLVSIAKLQKYQAKIKEYQGLTEEFLQMPTASLLDDDQLKDSQRLAICIAPDLGMVSKYNQTLFDAVLSQGFEQVIWIGNQYYEKIHKVEGLRVLNPKTSSDDLEIEWLYDKMLELNEGRPENEPFEIFIAIPQMDQADLSVRFSNMSLQLDNRYDIVFEPNFEEANQRFRYFYVLLNLYEAYYQSKYVENMTRRIAMEAATDNAEDMREDLQNRYNQLRQEAITMEILELSQES